MDLRSGHPYWLIKNGLLATYPSLQKDTACEVAVIGAGITGTLTAYHLVCEGVDTLLVDRRDVATGSTAASTALLQHAADTELADLAAMVGINAAVRSYGGNGITMSLTAAELSRDHYLGRNNADARIFAFER